jgi:hypothetical protein
LFQIQLLVYVYAMERSTCFQHYLAFVTCVTFYRLERDAYPLFRTLRQKYKTSTDRDPVFDEVLPFL